jgi:hypothetical protein
MNQQFAQSRRLYLESAKARRDRQWTRICLANVKRVLDKEKAPTAIGAIK